MHVQWWQERITTPASLEPAWAARVERWYQLDTPAFVLAETYWRLREHLTEPPRWLLLASPGASNLTDTQFAVTRAPSPAKFVHTLPNIRSASLLQLMRWSGPVLCLQKDPETLIAALSEALPLSAEGPVWIASVTGAGPEWTGHILTLGGKGGEGSLKIAKTGGEARPARAVRDTDLLLWVQKIEGPEREFRAADFKLSRPFARV